MSKTTIQTIIKKYVHKINIKWAYANSEIYLKYIQTGYNIWSLSNGA